MRVISVQLDIAWEDKDTNHAKVRRLLDARPDLEDSLIVLPEMFSVGFSMNVPAVVEPPDGPTHTFLSQLARQHGAWVLGGVVTPDPGGLGRNEAIAYHPEGIEIARYCKMHPFTLGGESKCYAAGTCPVVFDCREFRVAPFICYDLRFPEVFRKATRLGAELFVVIANWPTARIHHWTALLKARAIENQAFVVGVNRCGTDPTLTYTGGSIVVDPHGTVIADAGTEEGITVAKLDKKLLQTYRAEYPFLADMRDPSRT